jgi:Golgi nucleoside diphosphatase
VEVLPSKWYIFENKFFHVSFSEIFEDVFRQSEIQCPIAGDRIFCIEELTIPAEAAKVLNEIDFQYGQERELCLSSHKCVSEFSEGYTILQQASKKLVQGESVDAWRYRAQIIAHR